MAGAAYREQMTSVDGFTRTPNGQVKFHKNTKKRRAEEAAAEEGMDVDMVDGNISGSSVRQKKAKKEKMALGQEFKAKVRSSLYISSSAAFALDPTQLLFGYLVECWRRHQEERSARTLCISLAVPGRSGREEATRRCVKLQHYRKAIVVLSARHRA